MFGKIKKWLSSLKNAAFADVANNLTTSEKGSVLDARQGKELKSQINQLNTNLHPQWNLVNSVSGSNVAGDTLQLTSSQNGWCVVSGFKYWDIAIIYVNNISLILEQNVGDSDAKTSFTHIFPVKKNDTVKIAYPANPQKREFSIRLYS